MSRKVLTVFAPMLAAISFVVLPAIAQAAEFQAVAGEDVKASSNNLVFTANSGAAIECTDSQLQGDVLNITEVQIQSGYFGASPKNDLCKTNAVDGEGNKIDAQISTNLQGGGIMPEIHWTLQEEKVDGPIKFEAQLFDQIMGVAVDIATCEYEAPEIPITVGGGLNPAITIGAGAAFTKVAGMNNPCGTAGSLTGGFSTKGLEVD